MLKASRGHRLLRNLVEVTRVACELCCGLITSVCVLLENCLSATTEMLLVTGSYAPYFTAPKGSAPTVKCFPLW